MHAAARQRTLPKGLSDALMTVHAKHPFPDTPDEIAAPPRQVRDPNFRVQVSADGLHVYNRDGLRPGQGAFELWPQLRLENDAAHAFYMGVELAHARDRLAPGQTLRAGPAAGLGLRGRARRRRT